MIDTLAIISNGGAVLWQHSTHETGRRAMVNRLVQDVLLEDRAGVRELVLDEYKLRWALENDNKFFAVAVYPKFLVPQYMDSFLRDVVTQFNAKYGRAALHAPFSGDFDFTKEFQALRTKLESSEAGVSAGAGRGARAAATETAANKGTHAAGSDSDADADHADHDDHDDHDDEDGGEDARRGPSTGSSSGAVAAAHRSGNVLVTKDGRRIGGRGKAADLATSAAEADAPADGEAAATGADGKKKRRKGKAPTTWGGPVVDPAVKAQANTKATEAELQARAEMQKETYIKRLPNGAVAPVKEKEWEGQSRGRLANWLRSYVGSRELDEQDLKKVIPQLREKLIAKNVAVEVAEHVCQSVEASMAGKRLGTFDSLYKVVESSMTDSLRRILQPKHEVNILRDVASAKARKRPYSIVLCGVNGVGKSTSLAKIAYWLLQNNDSVLIAAGDTFRHGAVEQLEVHGRCLGVPVFQMGYGTDPSAVTAAAIAQATRQHTDVVMVDTAGRMQDHESRMRALAKLIHDNQPDLVLFVGEALVGNTGVDQLRRFNQCLVDYAPIGSRARGIDGIVLTKFDTIDDKVGAALSMVYELGQPIVFVGVGQTYQDMKVIEPDVVVSALMK